MYLNFYGLKEDPFSVTSNPGFFLECSPHKEALSALLYGIKERKGIILVTGEVGTGKTTLCKILLERLDSQVKTSLVLNPYFSPTQLLQAIVEDFGIIVKKRNKLDIAKELTSFLLKCHASGANAVVVIDEAQNLSARQLEQIRLLTNLETSNAKLLQIILVGQPELMDKINDPALRQIKQRIFVKCSLVPLTLAEVKQYIRFRLTKAGKASITITPESYKIIYEFSGGIPRLINMLCDRAMLLGYLEENNNFDERIFKICSEELA
ncbi:MAG: AAA family ATPase [Candidatus Omnitrophota bacterium]